MSDPTKFIRKELVDKYFKLIGEMTDELTTEQEDALLEQLDVLWYQMSEFEIDEVQRLLKAKKT